MADEQKISLQIASTSKNGGEIGPKLTADDLIELGLDDDARHVKLEFDHGKTISHGLCLTYLSMHIVSIIMIFFYPCIRYAISTSAHSRKAAVTERQLVLKQGAYGCCCCCWNEKTKSVSLEKITDLSVSQGCLERCFDIKSLSVENASSSGGAPEMVLVGLIDPEGTRKLVLKTRDNNGFNASNTNLIGNKNNNNKGNKYNNLNNPLLNNNNNKGGNDFGAQNYQINIQQAQTLTDIKDLLIGVKQSLDTLNNTMSKDGRQHTYQ